MSTPQNIVELNESTKRSMGSINGFSTSDTEILSEAFYVSPMVLEAPGIEKMTNESVKKYFRMQVMRGWAVGSNGYWAFPSEFSRDYVGAPLYDFKWKAAGDPLNSFVPNIKSIKDANPFNTTDPIEDLSTHFPEAHTSTQLSPYDSSLGLTSGEDGWGKDASVENLGKYVSGYSDGTPPPVEPAPSDAGS